jgi:hypothetical protein
LLLSAKRVSARNRQRLEGRRPPGKVDDEGRIPSTDFPIALVEVFREPS